MNVAKFHLYKSLGVPKDSSVEEITRSYRKLALQYHPDRNPDGVEQFKAISNAYAILSDPERRAVYDLTGFVSDGAADAAHNMSDEAARQQRSAELADQVHHFFTTYAGSAEEKADVVEGFHKCDGNFRKMVREYLLFDNGVVGEVQRLHRLVEKLVADGTLSSTAAWQETSTPRSLLKVERAMQRERAEAEEALKELAGSGAASSGKGGDASDTNGDGGLGALQLAIRQRQQSSYQSMLDNLEAKYVRDKKSTKGPAGKRSREAMAAEPADAEGEEGVEENAHRRKRSEKKARRDDYQRGASKRSRH